MTSTSQSSHSTSRSNVINNNEERYNINKSNHFASPFVNEEAYLQSPSKPHTMNRKTKNTIQSSTPELISGYPIYDNKEGCVVYKFDFSGFDQSEIHLTITVDRTLEIKACRESQDHLGNFFSCFLFFFYFK